MNPEQQKALVFDLIRGLLRSWWTLVAGVCVGASVAIVALYHTEAVFQGHAKIDVDVQKLPPEFVRRTVSDDVEHLLAELKAGVLSPENLHRVIVEAFGETPQDEPSLAAHIVSNVNLIFSGMNSSISVMYQDTNPRRAADVTNLLAELFVNENKRIRTETAQDVRKSMEGLSSDVTAELQTVEQALTDLSQRHPHELETQRLANEERVARLRSELEGLRRSIAAGKRRVGVLRASAQHSGTRQPTGAPPASAERASESDPRIAQLEAEVQELLRTLTERHPNVIAKLSEIERLKKEEASKPAIPQPEPAVPEEAEPPAGIDPQGMWLRAAELEVERLENEETVVAQEVQRYEGYLANTPRIQKEFDDLTRRHQLLRQMHEENQRKITTAKNAEQLEAEDIGNPFVITGYAAPPSKPVFPDPVMFLGAGIVGGLLLFVGPLLARVLLNPVITSEVGLRTATDAELLVAIPLFPTPATKRLQQRTRRLNLWLSAGAASVLCGVVACWHLNLL